MRSGRKWVERIKLIIFIALVSIYTASNSGELINPSGWESKLYADHNLVGMIWDSNASSFITTKELEREVLRAKYLILGEKHDNPDHHILQLNFVSFLLENNRLTQITFEMMDGSSQSILNDIHNENISSLDDLRAYLEWDEEGWNWSFYSSLLNAAYTGGIPIVAGNINNERMREVYGLDSLPDEFDVLDERTREQLLFDIDESHCGMLPESQFPAMVRVQQARDYSMALSMAARRDEGVGILIAGNYHARQDLGVPNYLLSNDKDLSMDDIISIGLMEVQRDQENPEPYLQKYGPVDAYDYIWFTPAISDEDYCASLRQQN